MECSGLGACGSGLWERPCVAKGPQSGPSNVSGKAAIVGALRTPFATQGLSHKVQPRPTGGAVAGPLASYF